MDARRAVPFDSKGSAHFEIVPRTSVNRRTSGISPTTSKATHHSSIRQTEGIVLVSSGKCGSVLPVARLLVHRVIAHRRGRKRPDRLSVSILARAKRHCFVRDSL